MSVDQLLRGKAVLVSVVDIKPNPWNYNTQKESTFTKLVASITRYGFTRPLIVRTMPGDPSLKQVIDGEHGLRAAKLLKMTEVPCIDLGDVDDVRAKEMTIVLNELGGKPDEARLSELLRTITETVSTADVMSVMPYTAQQLELLTSAIDFSFTSSPKADTRPERPPAPDGSIEKPKLQPKPKERKLRVEYHGADSAEVTTLLSTRGVDHELAILVALRALVTK